MITWLRLDTDPAMEFYSAPGALLTSDLQFRRLANIGALRRPLSVGGSAENANVTVTLDNGDGRLTEYFKVPPLRQPARLITADGDLFVGTITDCEIGKEISLSLEAGGTLPLSDRLPLRETTVWGSYKDKATIPLAYGRPVVTPVAYDNDGLLFVCADHACQGVDEVKRDGQLIEAWAFYNDIDDTGHPIAVLELADPLAEGEQLAVRLRGKMHPTTGALLTNPAFVLWDLLANVCTVPTTLADLDQFRVETAIKGIEVGGVIDDSSRTIRAQIDDICQSIGAVWSGGMPGIARLYPIANPGELDWKTFDQLNAQSLKAESSRSEIVTVLRVLYDYVDGQPRRAVQFEAPQAIEAYGRIESEVTAHWLRSARLAAELGERLLTYQARPIWKLSWSSDARDQAPPGVYVSINHPRSPIAGQVLVMNSELAVSTSSVQIAAEAAAGVAPKIVMTRLSTAFEKEFKGGSNVVYNNGVATFTIVGDNGNALVNATATLDGTEARITDHQGQVQFETARGTHVLVVEATGYELMEIEVDV